VSVNHNSPNLSCSAPLRPLFCLNKCITTCYGCRNRSGDGGLPVPPLGLILKCNEARQYYDKGGVLQEKEIRNTYYHPDINCTAFQCSDIHLDDSVRSTLLPNHFELLQSVFGLSFFYGRVIMIW